MATASRAFLVFLALAAPAFAREPARKALSAEEERHNVLAEMWQRRILAPDAGQWSDEDMNLLERVRRAEAAGAVEVLRRRWPAVQGLVVAYKPVGAPVKSFRLTKEGYEKYLFSRSQDALDYFESKGVDAKWAFSLTDLKGRRLFDGGGLLTEAGESLYARLRAGRKAFWKTPSGEVMGNRRPPRALPARAPGKK